MWRFAGLAAVASLFVLGSHYLAYRWIDNAQALHPLLTIGVLLEACTLGLIVWIWFQFDEHVIVPLRTLATTLQTALHTEVADSAELVRDIDLGALGPAAADLLSELGASRASVEAVKAAAVQDAEHQKAQLAAVLQELDEAVLICTPAHRIRLYNRAAVALLAGHGEIGLGRSLTEGLAIAPIQHAWQRLCVAREQGQSLSTMAVCSPADDSRLFQCRISLLAGTDRPDTGHEGHGMFSDGYLLSIRDITAELAAFVAQDRLLTEMLELARDSSARLHGQLDTLDQHCAAMDGAASAVAPLVQDLLKETARLAANTREISESRERLVASSWPMEEVYASDLFDEIGRRVAGHAPVPAGASALLRCDSLSIIALLVLITDRINERSENGRCQLSAVELDNDVVIEVAWQGRAVSRAETLDWLKEGLPEVPGGLSGRDILLLHQSALIVPPTDADETMHRIGLPLSRPEKPSRVSVTASVLLDRPEFYDFDIDDLPAQEEWLELPLDSLSYVVFDTETTGLEPFNGDEIVQIAGMRVVNSRVLAGEVFDTFVDPERRIPSSSTRIHGISPAMVAGAPKVPEALQQFRRFSNGSVLVAHNAAFDMAFLKRSRHGVSFDNPVLDTVLLSAFLYDHTGAHGLEDLARRLGVDIEAVTRHTAIGDTWITAQVFVKLQALLRSRGINTLRQALDACHQMRAIRRMQARYG